jgi:glycosyltransferase involved in cell wall biosynthesis
MKEVVQDGVNGSIVPIGDVAMLADKMSWAIENRSIVRERGCANQISALNKFESKVIIQQFVSIYQELLA